MRRRRTTDGQLCVERENRRAGAILLVEQSGKRTGEQPAPIGLHIRLRWGKEGVSVGGAPGSSAGDYLQPGIHSLGPRMLVRHNRTDTIEKAALHFSRRGREGRKACRPSAVTHPTNTTNAKMN